MGVIYNYTGWDVFKDRETVSPDELKEIIRASEAAGKRAADVKRELFKDLDTTSNAVRGRLQTIEKRFQAIQSMSPAELSKVDGKAHRAPPQEWYDDAERERTALYNLNAEETNFKNSLAHFEDTRTEVGYSFRYLDSLIGKTNISELRFDMQVKLELTGVVALGAIVSLFTAGIGAIVVGSVESSAIDAVKGQRETSEDDSFPGEGATEFAEKLGSTGKDVGESAIARAQVGDRAADALGFAEKSVEKESFLSHFKLEKATPGLKTALGTTLSAADATKSVLDVYSQFQIEPTQLFLSGQSDGALDALSEQASKLTDPEARADLKSAIARAKDSTAAADQAARDLLVRAKAFAAAIKAAGDLNVTWSKPK